MTDFADTFERKLSVLSVTLSYPRKTNGSAITELVTAKAQMTDENIQKGRESSYCDDATSDGLVPTLNYKETAPKP